MILGGRSTADVETEVCFLDNMGRNQESILPVLLFNASMNVGCQNVVAGVCFSLFTFKGKAREAILEKDHL